MNAQWIPITASDGNQYEAYLSLPPAGKGPGLVLFQEIFGVNRHIRNVTDGFAAAGYRAVAPAMFDRVKPGVELGYTGDDLAHGREIRSKLSWDDVMADLKAGVEEAKKAGKVGVVGYCFGGTVAWLAATRLGIPAVGYYGGGGVAHRLLVAEALAHGAALGDAGLVIADVDVALDPVEERRGKRGIALGGEAFGDGAHVPVDAEDLLDDDEAAFRLALRLGDIGADGLAVARLQLDGAAHMRSPQGFAVGLGPSSSRWRCRPPHQTLNLNRITSPSRTT